MPSPNQLLRKIIIKNKKKHSHHRPNSSSVSGNGELRGAGAPSASSGTSTSTGSTDVRSENVTTARLQKANSKDSQTGGSSGNINGTEADGTNLAPNGNLEDTDSESGSDDEEYVGDGGPIERKESTDRETVSFTFLRSISLLTD